MKRFLTISTIFALTLAFTGCQFFQKQPEPTETDTEVSESTTATVNIVEEGSDSATSTGTLVIEGDAMMDTMLEGSEMMEDDKMVGGDAMVGDDDAMIPYGDDGIDDTMMEDEA